MSTVLSSHHFALAPLTVAICLGCLAAHPAAASDQGVERIRIEGQQLLRGTQQQQLDQAAIQKQLAATSDTASLLAMLAGISVQQAGAVSGLPVIRGLADDRLRVKVDGMDLISACPNHMNPPLSYMAPTDVGRITVFAGISPVSLGGDSIGGSIISESKAPVFSSEASFAGEIGSFYRSNNQARGANIKLDYSSAALFASYSGNWSRGNNYRAAADFKTLEATGRPNHSLPLDEVGSSAYETQNHSLRLALATRQDVVDLQLGYQNMPSQLYPNQRMDLLDNQQRRINLSWDRTTPWGQLHSRIYHESVEHFMDFGPDKQFWYGSNAMGGQPCDPIRFHGDPNGTCAAGMPMHSDADTLGFRLSAELERSATDSIRLGVEYQQFRLDDYWTASGGGMGPGTFLNINDGKRDRRALFAEHELQASAAWVLLYGVRLESVLRDASPVQGYSTAMNAPGMQLMNAAAFNQAERRITDNNLDLTVLSRYAVNRNWQLELGAAQKVRSPNLYETYPWSFWPMAASMNNLVGDGNGYVGNLALKPEKAQTVSASLSWLSDNQLHQVSLNAYHTRVKDFIDAAAANANWQAGQFNVLQYQNQAARLQGLDFTAATQLAANASGLWQLHSNISYLDAKNTDTQDGLYQTLPWQARFSLQQQLAGWDNSLEWQLVSGKQRLSSIRNEVDTAGYGLLNLRLSHSWQRLRLDLGVENLLNKFYTLPAGGSYVGQGTTMSLNGIPFGIGVPGMGRSVYAGMQLSF